jgi:hypothetical protein
MTAFIILLLKTNSRLFILEQRTRLSAAHIRQNLLCGRKKVGWLLLSLNKNF